MIVLFILTGYALMLLNGDVKLVQLPTPIILTSYILLFASCGNFSSNKKGEAPWLLLANGITDSTPSVEQPNPNSNSPTNGTNTVAPNRPNSNGTSSGGWTDGNSGGGTSTGSATGSASSLVPPTGMFFLHPDHLGSVNMISDGFGNLVSGGGLGGKSSINYKPYGEIHRTDSGGPDVSKFKYTGQEEDKESGLMYYKARYYDPALGRFLQADSVVMPERTFGLNSYMYVDGQPLNFTDRSGHKLSTAEGWAILGYLAAPQFGITKEDGALWGATIGYQVNVDRNKARKAHIVNEVGNGIAVIASFRFGWVGLLTETWRRTATRSALKKGLDNNVKLAALGYMLNREEGGYAGYMLGSIMDEKKYQRRKRIVNENTILIRIGVGLIAAVASAGSGNFAGAGAALGYTGTEVGNYFYDKSTAVNNQRSFAVSTCIASFIQHTDKNPTANETIDFFCGLLSAEGYPEKK